MPLASRTKRDFVRGSGLVGLETTSESDEVCSDGDANPPGSIHPMNYGEPELLFAKYDGFSVIENRKSAAETAVQQMPSNVLAKATAGLPPGRAQDLLRSLDRFDYRRRRPPDSDRDRDKLPGLGVSTDHSDLSCHLKHLLLGPNRPPRSGVVASREATNRSARSVGGLTR